MWWVKQNYFFYQMKWEKNSEKSSGSTTHSFLIALSESFKVLARPVPTSNISDCTTTYPDYFLISAWQFCVPGKEWIWLGFLVSSVPAETVPAAPMKTTDVWKSWGNDHSLWAPWTCWPHHVCDVESRATYSATAAYPEYPCHLCRSAPYSCPELLGKKIQKLYERKATK